MSLQQLLAENRLEERPTSKREIADLLAVALRSLSDAAVEQLSLDGRFNCAYDAVLMLATVPLRCAGYRTIGEGHHFTTFEALSEIMGSGMDGTAQYLQKCRAVRNMSTYSRSGIVARSEVLELIAKAQELDQTIRQWVSANYPQYL